MATMPEGTEAGMEGKQMMWRKVKSSWCKRIVTEQNVYVRINERRKAVVMPGAPGTGTGEWPEQTPQTNTRRRSAAKLRLIDVG